MLTDRKDCIAVLLTLLNPIYFGKLIFGFYSMQKGLDFVNAIKPKLNEENRLIILKIKNEMRDKTKHGKEVSGIDVYKAVLENGVKNLKQFRKYLKEQGKVI